MKSYLGIKTNIKWIFLATTLIVILMMLNSCWRGDASSNNTTTEITTTIESSIPSQNDSDNLCIGAYTAKDEVVIPELDKPNYLVSYADPIFGSKVTRISQAKQGGVIKPVYNTIQAWNADESLLMLYHTGTEDSGHHLYNGHDYSYLRKLDIVPSDLEEVFWNRENPDYFYYMNKAWPDYASLMRYNVSTDENEIIKNLRDVCGEESYPGSGNDVQMMSLDSDKIGLRCKNASSKDPRDFTFFYSISEDKVSPLLPIGGDTDYDPWAAVQPANSGERFLLGGDVLDSNLNVIRSIDTAEYSSGRYKPEHASLGKLSNGHDALFSAMYSPSVNGCDGSEHDGIGALTAHDLETGSCRVLIGEDNGFGYPLSGTHPSALSYKNPGWIAVSTIGNGDLEYLTNKSPSPILMSEIYLSNSDENNPIFCRLAHHRSHGKSATSEDYNPYFGEPHPVISPSGTRILFGSDWYDSGSVDSYVIELPAYAKN